MGLKINEWIWHLWRELRRRRVLHAVGLYLAGGWLVLQIFDIALVQVGLPEWTMTLSVWLVITGLPVATVLSWRYDITREGISRTPPPDQNDTADLSLTRVDYLAILLIIGFIVGASLSLTRVFNTHDPEAVERNAEPNSIAVLPFKNLGGRPEDEYLALGLAEDILHRLAIIGELHVASRTAAFDLETRDMDISAIGNRLGVKSVLEGSLRRDGNRLRIIVQLIDSDSGYRVWSGKYDREMEDLFAIYDEISTAVAGELQLTLAPESKHAAPPTSDIRAYDYFLQARSMLQSEKHAYGSFQKTQNLAERDTQANDLYVQARDHQKTTEGVASVANAHRFFSRAVEIDPGFAQAWAGRCQALMDWYYYQPENEKIAQAESSCSRALELDPGLAEGHVALGDLYRKTGWLEQSIEAYESALENDDRIAAAWLGLGNTYSAQERDSEAERALKRAMTLDPNDLRSYYALGVHLFRHGRYREAAAIYVQLAGHPSSGASAYNGQGAAYFMLGDFQRAADAYRQVISTNPTASAYSNVGTQYFYNGQYEDAAVMYRQAISLGPTKPLWWGNLGDALKQMDGGMEAALEAYRKAAGLAEELLLANPENAETLTNLAHYLAQLGEDGRAMHYLSRALTAAPHDIYAHYYAALVHLQAGRRQNALDAIRRSVELGYPLVLLRPDPQFLELRDDESFLGLTGASDGLVEQESS